MEAARRNTSVSRLIRGLALTWEQAWGSSTPPELSAHPDLQLPAWRSLSSEAPLSLAADRRVTWLLADDAGPAQLDHDLHGRQWVHARVSTVMRSLV